MMSIPAANRAVARTDNSDAPAIDVASDTSRALGAWLDDCIVIEDFEQCKQGDAWIERCRIALAELEAERRPKSDPLYAQWKSINEPYSRASKALERVFDELRRRVSNYKNAVEKARIAEANRLRREAEDKERLAREAEAREADAKAAVDVGICESVGSAIVEADASFHEFQKADRAAVTAEKNVPMRVASIVGGKALSMRTKRVLVIDDWQSAIEAMGLTPDIQQGIMKSARAFESAMGELPPGISETFERSM